MNERNNEKSTRWWLENYIGFTILLLSGVALLIALFQTNLVNFLFFHTFTELISITIMWAIFILVWNTRSTIDNYAVLFLGIAFAFVGFVDLLHTITYKGMGVVPGNDPNMPTQFWIASRYLQSFSMLAAPLLLYRRPRPYTVLFLFAAITLFLVVLVFRGAFPDCFIEGTGLTPFKKGSEYFIITILAVTMVLFYLRREEFDPHIFRLILLSIAASIISELSFTFYVSVYGLSNFIGHCFKIIAVLFLYKAVIEVGIAHPFRLFLYKLKRKDQELRASEERFRTMFYEHNAIILQINQETGEIIDANKAATKFYGYTVEQLRRMTIQDINTLSAEEIAEYLTATVERGNNSFIGYHRIANGEIRTVEVHSTLIPSEDINSLFSIIHDITEREQAQRQLNDFFEQPLVIHLIAGFDGVIYRINGGWEKTLGYTSQDSLDTMCIDYVHPDDRAATLSEFSRLTEGNSILKFENRYRHKNGTYRILLWSATPSVNEKLIYATAVDITDRNKAEREQKKLAVQLQQSQKMEAIGTLAGGIAHDFNNILAAIIGYAEMARDGSVEGLPVGDDIEQILQGGYRARDLVKQILTFSRQSEIPPRPLQPALVVGEAIDLLRSSLPSTILIEPNIDSNVGTILADPTQIHQIVMNLGTNAFHAMEVDGGTLTIILREKIVTENQVDTISTIIPGNYIELSVRDTGVGISPEKVEKIFDPYFTTKAVNKGTGMGLAVIHGIVQNYGGYITCESSLGKGTIFYVLFPIVDESIEQSKKHVISVRTGTEHILFVDDEERIADMEKIMLERLGYRVTARKSSLEALTTFQDNPDAFDLVITDQTMPKMTGAAMAERMLQIRPALPIILCTGFSSTMTKEKAVSIGIKAFAHKPLSQRELTEKIREVLD